MSFADDGLQATLRALRSIENEQIDRAHSPGSTCVNALEGTAPCIDTAAAAGFSTDRSEATCRKDM